MSDKSRKLLHEIEEERQEQNLPEAACRAVEENFDELKDTIEGIDQQDNTKFFDLGYALEKCADIDITIEKDDGEYKLSSSQQVVINEILKILAKRLLG